MRRARRLTRDQEAAIRAFGATKSLPYLDAELGVSHETVRPVIRGSANHGDCGDGWYPGGHAGPGLRAEGSRGGWRCCRRRTGEFRRLEVGHWGATLAPTAIRTAGSPRMA
jgi:hypothetical protein